ncbi:pleckstrin homology domain-containing family O member 2 [Betta splendens]|uniref:Pleckstrin homology domain-containing family O member 2 n=1 Tax=Betta splendens TaxID=158456 RepID=A0A6P7M3Y0_BETSP|nr:pleckstrin homology domain-containing family O member 2 [Betta splendens]
MEDGVKEDLAQSQEPKFLAKAGWLRKAQGRLLTSYKERFVHVERTELVVYDNEDLLNCLERLDLENFDRCHELKSPFTKKHRLILVRTAKPGNKVHDQRFQAYTAEEKEDWIKALTDGINRAKNKVFDEVKVGESSNLEHVTRTRPKGNRNRRPPTRIHMKEVADVSSDGILRLDLDLENAVMPNGSFCANIDGAEKRKEATVPASLSTISEPAEELSKPDEKAEEEAQETQAGPKKKIIKPPMPPIKEAKPISALEEEPDKQNESEKKVLKPPVSPSKEHKPSTSSNEETSEEAKAEKISEKSPDARKKVGPPPTPPNKPSSQANSHPPTPPSKEKKPSHVVWDAVHSTIDENEEKEDNKNEKTETPTEVGARDDEDAGETLSSELLIDTEPVRLSSSPFNDGTQQDCAAPLQSASDSSGSSLETEEELPKTEVPSVAVSSNDLFSESVNLKAEEKSVDSGQHSDGDSEGSEIEDTLAVSTAALRGSQTALDVFDSGEGNVQISIDLSSPPVTEKKQVKEIHCWRVKPTPPLKPSSKVRSVSIGDLLSDCQNYSTRAGAERCRSQDVMKLETEVAVEMEKTSALLSRVSQSPKGGDGEGMPEDLLAKAMEKLKMADHVLKEVKKLKLAKNGNNRRSL